MTMIILILCIGATLALGIFGFQTNKKEQLVQERIASMARPSEKKTRVLREKQMEKSFQDRVLFPFAQMLFDKTQEWIPLTSKSWVKTKLTQAGYMQPNFPKVFLGIQLLCTVVLFGGLLTVTMLFGKINGILGIVLATVFGAIGYGLPMLWLIQQAQRRQKSIQKGLADFIDLLVICVEAGLGLDVALKKIAKMKEEKEVDFLRDEINRYNRDVNLGMPRRDALLGMADRSGVEDLNIVLNAIVQAYEMGSSVAHTLRIQADALRVKRLTKAEEKANQIPVKMVLPIYMFLFPSIFVVIIGPLAVMVIKAVSTVMGNMDFGH
jgi:tight adherence protein C